jgi:hypothetical protein
MTFLLLLLTYVVVSYSNLNSFNPANAPGFPFLSFLWSWSGSSHLNKKERNSSRFNFHLHLPSHFTVPILSPWSSVVSISNYLTMKLQMFITFICFCPLRSGGESNFKYHWDFSVIQLFQNPTYLTALHQRREPHHLEI